MAVMALADARAAKDKGNALYAKGYSLQALACYDQAIAACPKDAVQDFATLYKNRAACLLKLVRG